MEESESYLTDIAEIGADFRSEIETSPNQNMDTIMDEFTSPSFPVFTAAAAK